MLSPKTLNTYLINFTSHISFLYKNSFFLFLNKTIFIEKYYIRNEYIWQDGFLFDFLQKKTADLWIRQFVIYTGFLFSERFMFENIVKLYLDYLIWPSHMFSILETNNVSDMLNTMIYLYVLLFLLYISLFIIYFI